ncbi:hypothetical protein [Tissierella sp. Yu-01]|uniref:hypothetical protein n=1 Tax=Tissierella sp. Yu-01 TaxID=3035694 RepID=UPI00240E1ED6|nr:hypothetical protein [Tissierella sp. Yu-01]WFA08295.1 hypothetical protein P3962_11210 [Tissierella sp. Yu-01]
MKERIKTILLFSLVGMSLFLTQKLWIQLPGRVVESLDTSDAYSTSYALSDMIAPNKYILNFGNKNHTLFYGDSKYHLWEDSKSILTQVLGSESVTTEEITKEQYLNFKEERSLVFYFPEEINTVLLAKTWDVKDPNIIADTIPNIDEVYVYLGTSDPFFVFSDKNQFVVVYENNINTSLLKKEFAKIEQSNNYDNYYSMREVYDIENDIYMPYNMETSLPTVYVSNEIATLDDNEKMEVANRFFNEDINYIREIVESNGSTIYLYDKKSLKLNINGTLEYFHALQDKVPESNLYISLSTAAEFIMEKASSYEGMYLSSIQDIESDGNFGYRLTYKYRIRGIPVLLGNREFGDYIQIDVFNNHIRSYKLLTRREMELDLDNVINNRNILSSYDVLDKNYEFLVKEYLTYNNIIIDSIDGYLEDETLRDEILSSIEDVSLAYYDPNLKDKSEKLIGVWIVSINEKIYAFNVYSGNLVFER